MAAPNRRKFIGSTSTEEISVDIEVEVPITPFVNIVVPDGNPVTDTNYTIIFNWVDVSGDELQVEGFSIEDIKVSFTPRGDSIAVVWKAFGVGEVANRVTAFQNSQNNDDPDNSFNITISPPDDIVGEIEIEVRADAAISFAHITSITDNEKILLVRDKFGEIVLDLDTYIVEYNDSGPPEESSKRIETFQVDNRTISMNVSGADTLCPLDKDIISNDILNSVMYSLNNTDNVGGTFNGVLECLLVGNYLYAVIQIQKNRQTTDENGAITNSFEDNSEQAGAVLVRVNRTNCTFVILRTYLNATMAARSLVNDGDTIYFIEGSHYMYHEDVIFRKNRDLSSDLTSSPAEIPSDFDRREIDIEWKSEVGKVYSISLTQVQL